MWGYDTPELYAAVSLVWAIHLVQYTPSGIHSSFGGCRQNHPPVRPYFLNTSHSGQLQPLFAQSVFFVGPRAQKSAGGSMSISLFSWNVGQGPQNRLQISLFSGVSGTFIFSPLSIQ